MPETIDITPNWINVRAFVLSRAETDLAFAVTLAATMGDEAPSILDIARAANLVN